MAPTVWSWYFCEQTLAFFAARNSNLDMSDFDSPWKEAIEEFFEPFLGLLFPDVCAAIDWNRPYEWLDKELTQLMREAEQGKRYVDKLAQVWLKDGSERWILIHIEVQTQPDESLAERMYVYNYRVFDRYNRRVVSLAILGDDQPDWRPYRFGYELLGCVVEFRFRTAKLLDLRIEPRSWSGTKIRSHCSCWLI
jgi:hypothetical protein